MIRSHLLVCCSQFLIDPVDNGAAIVDIFDDGEVSAFPFIYPKFSVLWILGREEGDPEKLTARAELLLNSKVLRTFDFAVDFDGRLRTRAMLSVRGVAIERPGDVVVSCTLNGSDVSASYQYKLDVVAASASLVDANVSEEGSVTKVG